MLYVLLGIPPFCCPLFVKLALLLNQGDKETPFCKFGACDKTLLLVNNYRGLSNLEVSTSVNEV